MKINMKIFACLFVVIPFVVAAIMFCASKQNSLAKCKLGPVGLSKLTLIVGGSGEGKNCYDIPSNTCLVSLSDTDYCDQRSYDGTNSACSSTTGRVFTGNPTSTTRTAQSGDQPNSLGIKPSNVDCYTPYSYVYIGHMSYFSYHGYTCSSTGDCETDYDYVDFECWTCTLTSPGAVVTVASNSCADP